MTEHVLVYITAGSADEAERIAAALVEERLAACVNVVSPITSIYRWQGAIHRDAEVLLLAKTRRALFQRVVARVKTLHSYQVPDIVALPIVDGSEDYLRWIDETTGSASSGAIGLL